jgi:Fe-S-cluster-containing dehydrogenase component
MCYDRTTAGKKPMCATVCPSQALFFGTREQVEQLRPMSAPTNQFQFGHQTITTRVSIMVPRHGAAKQLLNVTDAMDEKPQARARTVALPVAASDPFAEVEV